MGKREKLIAKLIGIYDRPNTQPAVPIEEFFDGNRDPNSIAVNLAEDHPGLSVFRRVLSEIAGRADVQCVFAEIMDCPDPDEPLDKDEWPTCNVVFLITSAPLREVRQWLVPLKPTRVHRGWNVRRGVITPVQKSELKPDMRVIRVWWD